LANWKNPTGCTPALQLIDAYDSLRPDGPAVPPNVMRWCLFRLHEAGEIGAAVPTSDTPLTASSWRIRLAEGQGSKQRGGIPIEQTIVWLKLRAGAGSGPSLAQPRPLPESIQTIADPTLRQRATEAWRTASQLRRLMEQWETWFYQLERTGDADPGLALRM